MANQRVHFGLGVGARCFYLPELGQNFEDTVVLTKVIYLWLRISAFSALLLTI